MTILDALGHTLGSQVIRARNFDRLAGSIGIIPKELVSILAHKSWREQPRERIKPSATEELITKIRGTLLWGSLRAYRHRNKLYREWWHSDSSEDFRWDVVGRMVDFVTKDKKRKERKSILAWELNRKRRRISATGHWITDLDNNRLSRLNTSYSRDVCSGPSSSANRMQLRSIPRKIMSDRVHKSRDELILEYMDRVKRHPSYLNFF
jgi:hypothetical protein